VLFKIDYTLFWQKKLHVLEPVFIFKNVALWGKHPRFPSTLASLHFASHFHKAHVFSLSSSEIAAGINICCRWQSHHKRLISDSIVSGNMQMIDLRLGP